MENKQTIQYIAHAKKIKNSEDWDIPHELSEHLIDTSVLAKKLSRNIGSEWAELAGRWHDLGKFRVKFQDYIRLKSGFERENAHVENGARAPHSTAGAIHAVRSLPSGFGHIIAYLIAGHHAGLPDWYGGKGSLEFRLKDGLNEYEEALAEKIPENILSGDCPELPEAAKNMDSISLWMKMLFSCLVDADFLDTELYMQPEKNRMRQEIISLEILENRFSNSMKQLKKQAKQNSLTIIRNNILGHCYSAAKWGPGIFSLTVPTGGGKTLSSLAFALTHARIHQKTRVIYAIPFTSIIEQNADVFRKFIGDDAVLEHHSNFDVTPKNENSRLRLASENWDSPLIVTTNVQLFESLYASRTSRCRKLHNIVNSVIILDEAQQIPRDFHAPITQVMQQLADHFGVTWVLCTATQPELSESTDNFGNIALTGLRNVREISEPIDLARKLKRVDIKLPVIGDPKVSWRELSEKINLEDCVLVIVNTRRHARLLYELLPDDENNLHLSAHMCAQHRSEVIEEIKIRLKQRRVGDQKPLRVVSTQLIEAGVDVDFPVVYRAMAGLDSIAQAAGRCNREGEMEGLGKVIVFKPEQSSPIGFLRQGEDTTYELIAAGLINEPLSPESLTKYFSLMNSKGDRDKYNILDLLRMEKPSNDAPVAIQFRTAAKKFRLINDTGVSIIVPFIPAGMQQSPTEGWLGQLESDPSPKWIYKKLQRYTVTVPESLAKAYQNEGCLDVRAGQFVLLDSFYHSKWGVDSPEVLISAEKSVI